MEKAHMTTPTPEERADRCGRLTCRVSTLPTVTPMLSGLTIYKDGREVGFIPADGLAELRKVILEEANAATITPEERAAEIAAVWTEGVCGDGAVILRDGEPMAIGHVLDVLNRIVPRLRSAEQEAYKRGVEDAANIADDYALHSIELTEEFRAFGAAIRARATPAKE